MSASTAFTFLLETSAFLAGKRKDISVRSAEWYNLFECALYCCHFQEKLSLFSQILFSQRVTIEDSMQIDIQSSRLMSITDIYIYNL
jgi:hypothetical protein